jgi:uncharacterized protein
VKFGRWFVLLTAALFLCAVAPAGAAPALWVVQGPVGKIYLFGTVHVLRDGVQWHSPELDAAMAESKDLYLEVADPSDVSAAVPSLLKLGLDRDHPLSSKISKSDLALLNVVAKRYGLGSETAFEHMQPWLVSLMLSTMPAVHSGYASSNGVDLQVRKAFAGANKPILGLETIDTQMHLFSDESQATQVATLDQQLKRLSQSTSGVTELDNIVDAWLKGDQDGIASAMRLDAYAKTADLDRMIFNRNKNWANELALRLKQPGTSFVSVGAAHMLGSQGVPALLAGMGFTVTRVRIDPVVMPVVAPSPAPSASPSQSAGPSPSPAASMVPATLTPPQGWKSHAVTSAAGSFQPDAMWAGPKLGGLIMTGHLNLPAGLGTLTLDAFDALFQQGILSKAGAKLVQPSVHVNICAGTQAGTRSTVTLENYTEEIVVTMADRPYLAEYLRRTDTPEDPAAVRALLSLCAPSAPANR